MAKPKHICNICTDEIEQGEICKLCNKLTTKVKKKRWTLTFRLQRIDKQQKFWPKLRIAIRDGVILKTTLPIRNSVIGLNYQHR